MSDDLFIEEEAGEVSSGAGRAFAAIAGSMVVLILVGVICVFVLLGARSGTGLLANLFDGGSDGDAIAVTQTTEARLTENAIVVTENYFVTQTLAAMATEDALPTSTPEPVATNTPAPTETPSPTNTRVVDQGDGNGDSAAADPSPTVGLLVTSQFGGGSGSGSGSGTGGTSSTGELPQTGFGLLGAVAAALGLIGLGFAARRLRS